jgi:hypothetical protein
MTDLHWSTRRELECIIDKSGQADVADARRTIVETTSADEMLSAVITLIEFQSAYYAKAALEDRSKYPQRLEGAAKGLQSVLAYDLHRLQKGRPQ